MASSPECAAEPAAAAPKAPCWTLGQKALTFKAAEFVAGQVRTQDAETTFMDRMSDYHGHYGLQGGDTDAEQAVPLSLRAQPRLASSGHY